MLRPSLECWELDPANCFENYIGWDDCRIPLVIASRLLPFVKYGGSACNSLVLIHRRGVGPARHARRFSIASFNWATPLAFSPPPHLACTVPFNFVHHIN